MKLGDKMAPIEACNVWNDVCPRKTRPPKIGDIPRHVAVDEESPGSSSSRSVSQVRQTSGQSRLERSSVCHTNYEKCLAPGTLPLLETLAQPPSSDSSKKLERVSRISRGLDSERAENLARSLNSNSSSIPIGKTFNAPTSIFTEISTTLDSRNPDVNVPRDSSEKNSCAQLLKSIGETIAQEDQVPEEIIQVRKDSALYIDEKESPDAEELRKSLVAIGVGPRSSIGALSHQRNVEGTKNCRFFGADGLSAARRESSGYFSNLGTFDEDRWGSSCTSELANQQETRESLRERRRSSTKNRLPMGGGQQINRMTTIVCPTNDEDAISSSDNDAFAVTKTGRIEMPNIDEQPSLETNKSIEIERSPDKEFSREESQSSKRISKISMDNSASVNKNLPIIAKSNESSKNEVVTKKLGFNNRSMDTKIAREESEMCDRISQISVDNLPSNSLVRLADNENSSSIGKNTGSSNDVVDTKELGRKLGSGDQGSQSGANNRAANRQRSRMVVHQYSSPNITNSELERILERPQSEDFLRSKRELTRVNLTETVVNISSPGGDCEEDDDEQVVAGCLRETDGNEENETDTTKLLPRSIKVYQLLATQSEDRGDGDARLFDRRISLQIARNEEEEEEAIRENACGDPLPVVCRNIPSGSEYVEEKKLVHADSVPILKIPSSDASAVENESPLCAAERISGSNNLSGPPTLGIRPIYPYCPYSPYASPQGSPRTNRRRPLRESRRVSIDSRQGALQLNQYKLLNNIGQGSFGIVKLAYNEEDGTHYAMKILSKKKLMKKAGIFGRIAPGRKGASNPLAKVYREIALLKKLDHPNVVKLVEVLDDPDEDNLYLVFELVQKGEVLQLPTDKPLDEETARINFRDVVMGVEYLHYQRIVHRDIKPSNLLVDSEGRVKVADLGVSAELRAAGELLSGSAGTPAFAAPETTTPGAQYSGTLCDVWSMGVTLYSLVTGKVPWDGAGSIIGVQSAVRSEPLRFPDTPLLSENLRDLVTRMLCKDPTRRITLAEIKEHSWITNNGKEPLPNETENCRLPVTVTDEEVARVVTRVPKLDTLILIKTMLKQHSFQNPFLPRRIVRSGCTTSDADISGTNLKKQVSSDTTDSSTEMLPTTENLKSKTEQFHKAGRSNSAPDSYEWQANGRQISSDSLLPPVAESSSQEQAEVEKR